MSGFGLYETLRILVPGWFVVAFLDVGVRLALGDTPVHLTGDVAAFIEFLENPLAGLGIALVAGLLLYAMDIPTKTGVYVMGDPDNGKEPPTRHLSRMLTSDELKRKAMSLYFFLQDEFMNQEAHRKVYLFGSLYRIFVDLRVLAAVSFVSTVVIGFTVSVPETFMPPPDWLLLVTALWIAPYLYDLGQHAVNSVRKHEDSLRAFLSRRRSELSVLPLVAAVFLINTAAAGAGLVGGAIQLVGTVLAVLGVGIWLRVEMGTPSQEDWGGIWWWIARKVGAPDQRVFTTHQRALLDFGTYVPWVVVAAILTARTNGDEPWVMAWLAFLIPLSIVLGYHKHEDRLRNSFGDQNTWLDLHATEIAEIDSRGRMPVTWWER